jgi:hypothetical protein
MSKPREKDQWPEIWVARCSECGAVRFQNQDKRQVEEQVATPGVWDVQASLGTLAKCCRTHSRVELWVCPECARVPGQLEPGVTDKTLPAEDCSRCGRPYRGIDG